MKLKAHSTADVVCMKLCLVCVACMDGGKRFRAAASEPTTLIPGRPIARACIEIGKARQMNDRVQVVRAESRCVLVMKIEGQKSFGLLVVEEREGVWGSRSLEGNGAARVDQL